MKPTRILALLAVAAFAVAGCGDDRDDDQTTPDPDPPAPEGDEVLLQVSTGGGGFLPPGARLAEIPEISVFADGRLITIGPSTLEFPGTALPNLVEGRLSATELDALGDAIADAGLTSDPLPEYGDPGITDSPTTVVTTTVNGEERSVSAYALEFEEGDDQLEPGEREARQKLRALIESVDVDQATKPYEADAVAVFVEPFDAGERGDSPPPETREWPLGDLASAGEPYEDFENTRCLVVTGDDAQTVLETAEEASEGDIWTSGGAQYAVSFRPMLPNESSCADLHPEQFVGA